MIFRLPSLATLLVALASGVLAAQATHDVALRTGALAVPVQAWLLPMIVEGAAVTAAALAWRRTGQGLSAWPERCALAVLIALATVVNAAHAQGGHLLGVVLAACPPLVLLGAVELLLRSLATASQPLNAVVGARIDAVEAPERPQTALQAPPSPLGLRVSTAARTAAVGEPAEEPARVPTSPADRVQALARRLAAGEVLTGSSVAADLGVSSATGRRLLAAARALVEQGEVIAS